jgi:hypothetical protein
MATAIYDDDCPMSNRRRPPPLLLLLPRKTQQDTGAMSCLGLPDGRKTSHFLHYSAAVLVSVEPRFWCVEMNFVKNTSMWQPPQENVRVIVDAQPRCRLKMTMCFSWRLQSNGTRNFVVFSLRFRSDLISY